MHWRLIDGERVKAQLQWEPRDLWVGLFWRTNHEVKTPWYTLHLYVCILPLLPLHITLLRRSNNVLTVSGGRKGPNA